MFTIELVSSFLGWCSIISIAILTLSTALIAIFNDSIVSIHNKITGIEKDRLTILYFQYLGNLKLITIVIYVVPYIAIQIIS